MKYIVVAVTTKRGELENKVELPIIFPKSLVHLRVYDLIKREMLYEAYHNRSDVEVECVSAGFINIATLECSGYSETINKKSRGAINKKSRGAIDTILIKTHDYNHGLI